MVGQKLAQRPASSEPTEKEDVDVTFFDMAVYRRRRAGQADRRERDAPGNDKEARGRTFRHHSPPCGHRLRSVRDQFRSELVGEHDVVLASAGSPAGGECRLGRAIRAASFFHSSIAVFGGPYPDKISDDFLCAPQTSYGAQKAFCELMIGDVSRKGVIDGMSLRLSTICVRPARQSGGLVLLFGDHSRTR